MSEWGVVMVVLLALYLRQYHLIIALPSHYTDPSCSSSSTLDYPPPYCARAVYQTPCASVVVRVYLRRNLSRSFESSAMSVRKGAMSAARHRGRVRKRSAKRAAGSTGRDEAG